MNRYPSIIGQKFNRLTAIKSTLKKDKHRNRIWIFCCDCGVVKKLSRNSVTTGNTKSCGCLFKEVPLKNTTHGMTRTRFYAIWGGILTRCYNKRRQCFKNYGGRGIKCSWKSFEEFYKDMFQAYLNHIEKMGINDTTIDRIDVNKDYSKENCRWSTWKQQSQNKRNTIMINFNGENRRLAEWSKIYHISYHTLYDRWIHGRAILKD